MALDTNQYGYLIDPLVPITDATGRTIKDGFLRVYIAGSSTPVITYRNFDESLNEKTIELDNSGRCKYPVIVSKSLAYKVVVYDAQHSQETPIITVDKLFAIGASVTAGAGATVVTGLDGLTTKPHGFVDASVVGTDGYVALDHTLVTDDLDTNAKVTAVEEDRYIPLLNEDVNDPDSKTTLGLFWKWVLGKIKNLTTTITAFRTGDVIPVDGPSGTAKMSKNDLLRVTSENALGSIKNIASTATEADLVVGNYFAIDGTNTKKLPAEYVAQRSVQDHIVDELPTFAKKSFINEGYPAGFFVTDENENIGMKYDEDGLDAAKVSKNFVNNSLEKIGYAISQNESIDIVDKDYNVFMRINKDGVSFTKASKEASRATLEPSGIGTSENIFAITDEDLNAVLVVNKDGLSVSKFSKQFIEKSGIAKTGFEKLSNIHLTTPSILGDSVESAFSPSDGLIEGGSRRIPSSCVTNSKTIIFASQVKATASDYAESGIGICRIPSGGSATRSLPFPYNYNSLGSFMNASLVVDRTTGYIYLFFLATRDSNGWGFYADSSKVDCVYSVSTDDGVTWSDPVSLNSKFDSSKYAINVPAPANGCQLTDGTLVIPCVANTSPTPSDRNLKWLRSSALVKKTDEDWEFLDVTPYEYDNECTAYEGIESNELMLMARNEGKFSKNIYKYDFVKSKWIFEQNFDIGAKIQTCVTRTVINDKPVLLMSAIDPSYQGERNNVTLFASDDGAGWVRVVLIDNDLDGGGYADVSLYDGVLVLIYEKNYFSENYVDLSNAISLILPSISFAKYTIEDKLNSIIKTIGGI